MFSKASLVGAAILITTIAASIGIQIREGFGDDPERSVLVRSDSPTTDSQAEGGASSRYAEPKTIAPLGESSRSTGSDSAASSGAASRTPPAPISRYGDAPRTASGSNLVDRLRSRTLGDSVSSGDSNSNGGGISDNAQPRSRVIERGGVDPRANTEPVPFRRPGALRSRGESPSDDTAARGGDVGNGVDSGSIGIRSTRPGRSTPSRTAPSEMREETTRSARNMAPRTSLPGDSERTDAGQTAQAEGMILRSTGPVIVVEAVGPSAIQLNKPATYVIRAANAGAAPGENLFVRLQLPASAELLGQQPSIGEAQVIDNGDGTVRIDWRIDEIAARGEETLTLNISARERSPLSLGLDWTFQPRQATAQIEVQEPQLDVHVVGPRAVMFGDTEVYTVTVSNPGTGAAEDVVLDVALVDGPRESKRIGVIPAGGREVIKLELTAGDAGEMPILAAVRGAGGLTHEFEHRVVVRRAKLEISVDGPSLKYAGSSATFTVSIRNTGDAPADAVDAAVQLPSGAEYRSGLTGAQQSGQKLGWRVGVLQPGDERSFTVRCELTVAGENRLNAVASSANELQAATVHVTRVEAIADLKLLVNDPQGPQAVGDEVEYEITVLNRGTKSASNVNVVAHFAKGVEPTGAEGVSFELAPGQVIFRAIPRVGPGQSIVLKVRAKASKGGDHRFRAEVRCDEPNTQLIAEETTRYFGEPAASTARR